MKFLTPQLRCAFAHWRTRLNRFCKLPGPHPEFLKEVLLRTLRAGKI